MDITPLEGIRVLDLTQAMAGPMATMLLGDLGAEVIKVEPLTGDQTRKWAPPYLNGMSAYFLSTNRNKKSISLDMKSNDGLEVFKKLVEISDVVIENFRPGTTKRLGISYNDLSSIKEELKLSETRIGNNHNGGSERSCLYFIYLSSVSVTVLLLTIPRQSLVKTAMKS